MSTKFEKGRSGNPSGRPKTTALEREFRDMAREHGPEALKVILEVMRNEEGSASARLAAASVLVEHGYGKPIARSEISVTKREVKELDDSTLYAIAGSAGVAEAQGGPAQPDCVH